MVLIETFLLGKLEKAIKDVELSIGSTHSGPEKTVQESDPSKRPMNLLSKPRPGLESTIKENLYSLNNKVLHIRNHHSLNLVAWQELKRIKEDHKVIKSKIDEKLRRLPADSDPKVYWWSSRLASPTVKIYGFEDRAVERLLIKTESEGGLKAVGLVGLAGVGKTTLSKVSFNNPQVEGHFFPRIWACLSVQPEMEGPGGNYQEGVVKRILAGLGFEDKILDKFGDEVRTQRLLFALRQQLKGRKYLLVLDDLWNSGEEAFFSMKNQQVDKSKLSYGLPRGDGGAVFVTSRSRKLVENVIGGNNTHHISLLEDKNNCWEILKDEVTKNVSSLEKIKDLVVGKCEGLPSAAKIMGKIASKKLQ